MHDFWQGKWQNTEWTKNLRTDSVRCFVDSFSHVMFCSYFICSNRINGLYCIYWAIVNHSYLKWEKVLPHLLMSYDPSLQLSLHRWNFNLKILPTFNFFEKVNMMYLQVENFQEFRFFYTFIKVVEWKFYIISIYIAAKNQVWVTSTSTLP